MVTRVKERAHFYCTTGSTHAAQRKLWQAMRMENELAPALEAQPALSTLAQTFCTKFAFSCGPLQDILEAL